MSTTLRASSGRKRLRTTGDPGPWPIGALVGLHGAATWVQLHGWTLIAEPGAGALWIVRVRGVGILPWAFWIPAELAA